MRLGSKLHVNAWAAGAALLLAPGVAWLAPGLDSSGFRRTGTVQGGALPEISGLAASRRELGLFWAVNDSGNPAVLHSLGLDGAPRRRVAVTGANNIDWEDLAAFQWQGQSWLAIADIGDNLAWRTQVTVYIVPEPKPDQREVGIAQRIEFSYDDGPRDAEALAVDVRGDRILILEKAAQDAGLYEVPLATGSGVRTARRIGSVPQFWPEQPRAGVAPLSAARARGAATAMDLSADGERLLVLTYRHAFVYRRAPGADWTAALAAPGTAYPLPRDSGFEAASFDPDDRSFWIVNEGQGAQLYWHRP